MASTDRTHPERPSLAAAAGPPQGDAQTGPAGIWHAYRRGARKTLCDHPLLDLYPWPGLVWPGGAPLASACYVCDLVAREIDEG